MVLDVITEKCSYTQNRSEKSSQSEEIAESAESA